MVSYKDTKKFWNNVACGSVLSDKSSVGMLADFDEYNAKYRRAEEEAHFLRIFKPEKIMRVLEVGTGGGRWAFFLSDKVANVVGIDFSENMITLAEQQRVARGIENINFVHTDLQSFVDEQKFDLIYFSGVLQYVNDIDISAMIKRAQALLKPSGEIISRDTVQELKRIELVGEYPVIYRTIDEYELLFRDAGFKLNYCELAYRPRRFTRFVSHIYALPFMSYKSVFYFQNILIGINSILGNPKLLMNKKYVSMLNEMGERQHRFFRYVAK